MYENELKQLLQYIATGKAILFAGAGFSNSAINLKNDNLPIGETLKEKIDKITGNSSYNLKEAAEYAIEIGKEEELINLLRKLYSIKEVHRDQINIIKLPWRRYYTTNYDSVIEEAGKKNNKLILSVTPDEPVSKLGEGEICLHINGVIDKLNNENLNTTFKLSKSSYLNEDPLFDTLWGEVFLNDLKNSVVIVFLGYSMYDYNIEKLLFSLDVNNELKNKVFFIEYEKLQESRERKLKKYGRVYKIGINNFANFVYENLNIINNYINLTEEEFECFEKFKIPEKIIEISHDNIRDFLIFGKYNNNYIYSGLKEKKYKNFIYLNWIKEIFRLVVDNKVKNIHLHGELGTGKSFGLKLLASELILSGKQVLFLNNNYGDFMGDIEKLKKINTTTYIIVDNAEKYIDILKQLYLLNWNHVIISASRTYNELNEEIFQEKAKSFSIKNILEENEVNELIDIVENIGYSNLSKNELKNRIEKIHNNSLPNFLLDFMNSDTIKKYIENSFIKLLSLDNGKYNKTLVAILLLGVFDIEIEFYIIQELTQQQLVREIKLLKHEDFKNFFEDHEGNIIVKSAIFAKYLLKELFLDNIKKDFLLEFVKNANRLKEDNNIDNYKYIFNRIFKELVKFYSLSKIFKNINSILTYFEQVKNELTWLQNDPNYWIQLTLLNLARQELEIAFKMIRKAESVAEKNKNFNNYDYIKTAKARFYIEKIVIESNKLKNDEIFNLFCDADNLLLEVGVSDNKYRQIDKYYDIYYILNNRNYFLKNKDEKNVFINRLKKQLNEIQKIKDNNFQGISKEYLVFSSEDKINKILFELSEIK